MATADRELLAEAEDYGYDSDSDLDESEDEPDMTSFDEEHLDLTEVPRDFSLSWSELDSMNVRSSV